jgi:hypothetical protein
LSNALINNIGFNGRDNGVNKWLSNSYSDYAGKDVAYTMILGQFDDRYASEPAVIDIGEDPYEIYGQRGAVTLDLKPFITPFIKLADRVLPATPGS